MILEIFIAWAVAVAAYFQTPLMIKTEIKLKDFDSIIDDLQWREAPIVPRQAITQKTPKSFMREKLISSEFNERFSFHLVVGQDFFFNV